MSECLICKGNIEVAVIAKRLGHRPDIAFAKCLKYEDLLFSLGAMLEAPCFCCGYDGPGYFQSNKHSCAERHHKLYEEKNNV